MVPPSQLVPPHDCCGDMLRKFRSLTRQKASNPPRFNKSTCQRGFCAICATPLETYLPVRWLNTTGTKRSARLVKLAVVRH